MLKNKKQQTADKKKMEDELIQWKARCQKLEIKNMNMLEN